MSRRPCPTGGRTKHTTEEEWRCRKCGTLLGIRRAGRVNCRHCGVKVEAVPWAEAGSRFTTPFEMHTTHLAKQNDKTTVTMLTRIAWETAGKIIQRVVRRERGDTDRLDGLRIIGVDELSYRRHHESATVVVDHERGEIVWAGEGKSAATLKQLFEALGKERSAKLEAVTIDMSAAYIKAVTEASPEAKIIFDRFHVQRLAHTAPDEVRRDVVREATGEPKKSLKNTRSLPMLRRHPCPPRSYFPFVEPLKPVGSRRCVMDNLELLYPPVSRG